MHNKHKHKHIHTHTHTQTRTRTHAHTHYIVRPGSDLIALHYEESLIMSSILDGIESAMQRHTHTHALTHAHPPIHTHTHSNRMIGAVCMAPVQLETETCFGSKMIRRPTADGNGSLKTFHHSCPKTNRPITSKTPLLRTEESQVNTG